MKKKLTLVCKGRTKALFNTGTRPHKSTKDYTRKVEHKQGAFKNVVGKEPPDCVCVT